MERLTRWCKPHKNISKKQKVSNHRESRQGRGWLVLGGGKKKSCKIVVGERNQTQRGRKKQRNTGTGEDVGVEWGNRKKGWAGGGLKERNRTRGRSNGKREGPRYNRPGKTASQILGEPPGANYVAGNERTTVALDRYFGCLATRPVGHERERVAWGCSGGRVGWGGWQGRTGKKKYEQNDHLGPREHGVQKKAMGAGVGVQSNKAKTKPAK